MIAII